MSTVVSSITSIASYLTFDLHFVTPEHRHHQNKPLVLWYLLCFMMIILDELM